MSDQQRPPMPQMSGAQRQNQPNYEQEILEGGQRPPFVLTPEDKALFDKCNRDSFFQRSLPLSLLCAGSVALASHRGLITTGKIGDRELFTKYLELSLNLALFRRKPN